MTVRALHISAAPTLKIWNPVLQMMKLVKRDRHLFCTPTTRKEFTMKTFYNNDYVASKYAFDTTRKAEAITESLVSSPIEGLSLDFL